MGRRVVTVFGGSGFVGRQLVRRLTMCDSLVRVGVRTPVAAENLKVMGEAGQVIVAAADVTVPESVNGLVKDADAVVNLVGTFREHTGASFEQIHIEGAANVARCAAAEGVPCLVHVSALGADAASNSRFARSKALGESEVKRAFKTATIVRPSIVFGPGDRFFNRFGRMARLSPILPFFGTRFQPVYVGDVAEAIVRILASPDSRGQSFELGGPRVMSFREACELVQSVIGRRRLLVPMPFQLADFLARLLRWHPDPPITRDQIELLKSDNIVAPTARTLRDLGIEPSAAEAIVPSYVQQYRGGLPAHAIET